MVEETSSLVCQAQGGDHAAYEQLMKLFRPVIYSLAMKRARNSDDTEEICQLVLIRIWEKLPTLREEKAFPSWVKQITVRTAINYITRRRLMVSMDSELEVEDYSSTSPLDEIVYSEDKQHVVESLTFLRPLDRNALCAFYLQGKTIMQISKEEKIPEGTVKRRLCIARRRLREHFNKENFTGDI